jgi:hypothetical protein
MGVEREGNVRKVTGKVSEMGVGCRVGYAGIYGERGAA